MDITPDDTSRYDGKLVEKYNLPVSSPMISLDIMEEGSSAVWSSDYSAEEFRDYVQKLELTGEAGIMATFEPNSASNFRKEYNDISKLFSGGLEKPENCTFLQIKGRNMALEWTDWEEQETNEILLRDETGSYENLERHVTELSQGSEREEAQALSQARQILGAE